MTQATRVLPAETVDCASAPRRALGAAPVLLALAFTLAGLGAALWMISRSNGFLQDDDVTHYLMAQEGWTNPLSVLHWWARPGHKAPAVLVAHFWGLAGCRIFSALQTAAVAFLAYRMARRILPRTLAGGLLAATAPAFLWLQPEVMTLALTTLTETSAALYVALAVYLYMEGRRGWACVALSPAFVTRYETAVLGLLFLSAMLIDAYRLSGPAHGKRSIQAAMGAPWLWLGLAALAWAPVAYAVAVVLTHLPIGATPLAMFHRADAAGYGRADWGRMLFCWLGAAGAGVLMLAAMGFASFPRRAALPAAAALTILLINTMMNHFSHLSDGYPRMMVPAGGMVAALAAVALMAAWKAADALSLVSGILMLAAALAISLGYLWWMELISPVLAAELALLLCAGAAAAVLDLPSPVRLWLARAMVAAMLVLAARQTGYLVHPLRLTDQPMYRALSVCLERVAKSPYADRPTLATHKLVGYLRPNTGFGDDVASAAELWIKAPPGTLFIWDSKYGYGIDENSDGPLIGELRSRGRLVATAEDEGWVAEAYLREEESFPTTAGSNRLGIEPWALPFDEVPALPVQP